MSLVYDPYYETVWVFREASAALVATGIDYLRPPDHHWADDRKTLERIASGQPIEVYLEVYVYGPGVAFWLRDWQLRSWPLQYHEIEIWRHYLVRGATGTFSCYERTGGDQAEGVNDVAPLTSEQRRTLADALQRRSRRAWRKSPALQHLLAT